jgi:hypothetical protein
MWVTPPVLNRFEKKKSERKPKSSSRVEMLHSGNSVREEYIQKGLRFLSHPSIRSKPEQHIKFLETKGLNAKEIQECINRLQVDEENSKIQLKGENPHPVSLSTYDLFITELLKPRAADIFNSFKKCVFLPFLFCIFFFFSFFLSLLIVIFGPLHSFLCLFGNLGKTYTMEDKSKMVRNQIEQLTNKASFVFCADEKRKRVTTNRLILTPDELMECVEKYLLAELYELIFCPTAQEQERDEELYLKIACLETFIEPKHLDLPSEYHDNDMWAVARQGVFEILFFLC